MPECLINGHFPGRLDYKCRIPQNKLHSLFATGQVTVQEAIYGHCAWVFVQHFLNRLGGEFISLQELLDPQNNNTHAIILSKLKRRLRTHGFRARMKSAKGREVLSRRRRKGRHRLAVTVSTNK